MKRTVSILMLFAFVITLSACNKSNSSDASSIIGESSAITKTESEISDGNDTASLPENSSKDNSSLLESKPESNVSNEREESPFTSYDSIGDLDKEIAIKIKEDYIKTDRELKNKKLSEIHITKYYGTFSDGSIFVTINPVGATYIQVIKKEEIAGYKYHTSPDRVVLVYKNSKFYGFKEAYDEGIISKKVVDEFFTIYSYLLLSDEDEKHLNKFDSLGELDTKTAIKIKEDYIKSDTEFKKYKTNEIVIWSYYGTFSDGSISVAISPIDYTFTTALINEDIAGYAYNASSSQYYAQFYKNSRFCRIKEAYETGFITKEIVDEYFSKITVLDDEDYSDDFNGYDKIGDLDKNIALKIKRDFVNSDAKYKKYKALEIVIWKYFGTLSDGSIALTVGPFNTYYSSIIENQVIAGHRYDFTRKYEVIIYKNSRFYKFKDAYDEGIISKQIVDEIFEIYNGV